ncbi:MAG: DinB family protein [Acidobacteriota bacterium]
MHAIGILKQTRTLIDGFVAGTSEYHLVAIPEGFRNNILWNLGHVVVTQQLLHYRLSGQDPRVADELVEGFRNGTSPADWTEMPDVAELRRLAVELPERLDEDVRAGRLSKFSSYTTSKGVVLTTLEDAISFNNVHEGMHLGIMMSLRNVLSPRAL